MRSSRARIRAWATLVYPDLSEDEALREALERARARAAARRARPAGGLGGAHGGAERLGRSAWPSARFDAIELRGPGTELTVGMLPTHTLVGGRLHDRRRPAPLPEPADRGGVHDAGPERTSGHVTSTKPLVLRDGTIIRGLRVALRGRRRGRRSTPTRTSRRCARSSTIDDGALRLGELALVDRQGRIGPLGTVFYDTLLDENAASHIALGNGFPFLVEERRRCAREHERHARRLHDRLAGARGRRRHGRRRARARPPRRRLADLSPRRTVRRLRRMPESVPFSRCTRPPGASRRDDRPGRHPQGGAPDDHD